MTAARNADSNVGILAGRSGASISSVGPLRPFTAPIEDVVPQVPNMIAEFGVQ